MSLCKRLLAHEALCRLSSFSRIYASFHPVCFPTTSQNAVRAARPFPLSGLFPLPNGKLCSPRERNKSGRLSKFAGLHCDTLSQLKRVFSTKTSLLQPPKGEHGKIALVRCILCIVADMTLDTPKIRFCMHHHTLFLLTALTMGQMRRMPE